MVLLAITADTWIITGLGFGIVLLLLFCLVFILNFFGWSMQKIVAPREPKAAEEPKARSEWCSFGCRESRDSHGSV